MTHHNFLKLPRGKATAIHYYPHDYWDHSDTFEENLGFYTIKNDIFESV